ncbi:rhamnan synthesis F family protein [Gemmatimonas sp.]|uniref:rhamnan synthesis F family protein n=1 Tax=Gemmatimonas sp. TaxID=1962908 RepID=UPI003568FEDC
MPILIGPFDQAGIGGIVMPHVVDHLLRAAVDHEVAACLAAAPIPADLRSARGPIVHSYASAAARAGTDRLINVAGTAITWGALDALESALDSSSADSLRRLRLIDGLLADQAAALLTGSSSPLAYLPPVRTLFPHASVEYHGVDLAHLAAVPHRSRMLILDEFNRAEHLGVSSTENTQWLTDNKIAFVLEPPPIAAIAYVDDFSTPHPPLSLDAATTHPYLVVELDGASTDAIDPGRFAEQLVLLARRTDLRLVVLLGDHVGAASFSRHVRPEVVDVAAVFVQPDAKDVLALVQHSHGYIGSGVTGRAVAGSYAVPRRSVSWAATARSARLAEFCRLWDPTGDALIDDVSLLAEVGATLLDDDLASRSTLRTTTKPALAACWGQREPVERAVGIGRRPMPALDRFVEDAERNAARARLTHAAISQCPDPDEPTPDPSFLFDDDWYREINPDLELAAGQGFEHYRSVGWRDGRSPHPCFEPEHYLRQRPDLSDVEPFGHYLLHGWKEGRDPSVWFSSSHYLAENADVFESGTEPLTHYLTHGHLEDRDPSPHFDSQWYRRAYPVPAATSALVDHIRVGQYEGRSIHPPLPTTSISGIARTKARTAVVTHLHFPGTWTDLRSVLDRVGNDTKVVVTVTPNVDDAFRAQIAQDLPNAEIVPVANRGRDVLPLLALLPRLIDDGIDAVLKVHGKKSGELRFGDTWRQDLLDAVCPSSSAFAGIAERFLSSPDLGVAIPVDFAQPLNYHLRQNRTGLVDATRRLGIDVDLDDPWVTRSNVFPRGNMFWFRPAALAELVRLGLDDFEDEAGETDGTFAHVIERMPALASMANGYDVVSFIAEGDGD